MKSVYSTFEVCTLARQIHSVQQPVVVKRLYPAERVSRDPRRTAASLPFVIARRRGDSQLGRGLEGRKAIGYETSFE